MIIAFILAVIAACCFVVDFAKGLPAYGWIALGGAFFAASWAVYIWETTEGLR